MDKELRKVFIRLTNNISALERDTAALRKLCAGSDDRLDKVEQIEYGIGVIDRSLSADCMGFYND
jgi:hypothetical protein